MASVLQDALLGGAVDATEAARAARRAADYEMPGFVQTAGAWLEYFQTEQGAAIKRKLILAFVLFGGAGLVYRKLYSKPVVKSSQAAKRAVTPTKHQVAVK